MPVIFAPLVPIAGAFLLNEAVKFAGGTWEKLSEDGQAAAAKRIGKFEVDHGDTACKTPDSAQYIDKSWTHSTSKGFASPAAHERARESMRTRC